jgi:hypothetical protein
MASGSVVYDATLYNGATVSNNQLLLSAAQSQYMKINAFTTGTAGLTFATWWKADSNSGDWARIFDFSNGAYPSDNIIMYLNRNDYNNIGLDVYNASQGNGMYLPISFNQNNWNHIAWTITTSGTWVAYINGVLVTSATSKLYPRSIVRSLNYLGSRGGVGNLNGAIKDFRMYGRVLSAAEVSTLFNATRTIFIGATQCSNCSTGQYSSAGSASCLSYPTAAPTCTLADILIINFVVK